MKKIIPILIFLFFVSPCANSQKGETTLYFKNGDTISGIGKLKGAEFINFKTKKGAPYKKISFKSLYRADVILKDTVISFRLYPIVKKNGKRKEPSVIGQFESGEVNLYIKGETKRVGFYYHNMNPSGSGLIFGGTTDAIVHYFLRKNDELNAVHIGSSYFNIESLLKKTGDIFSECPELIKKILAESSYDTSIFEVISKYNQGCSQKNN